MKYAETHEWIEVKKDIGTVGVSSHAQNELGEIVYVELPKVGKYIKKGEEAAVLESTKAAADVYSPASGTIVEVNTALNEHSELITRSPENEGWLFKLHLSDLAELDTLMDPITYKKTLGSVQ
jgi:glycine cleavage system H protein